MAKGDQEKSLADIEKAKKEQSGNYYDYLNNVKNQGQGLNDQAKNERNQIWQTGTNYAATGGLTQEMQDRLRGTTSGSVGSGGGGGGGGSGSGGANQGSNYGNAPGSAFNYVGPSAFNDVNWSFDDARNIYNDLGNKQGGLTGEQLGNINRDTLKEFEKTGGYSDPQLADIRARSNSTVPAFYQSLQDQMSRNRISSGQSFGGAFDASAAKMARESAQQSAEQTRNTEIGLGDTVRKGRFDASSKLADLGLNTAQLISQNRMGAAGGLASIDLNDAQLKMLKAKGIDDYTIQVATGKDRYATAEDQIAAQKAIAGAGLNLQKMALDAQNERFLISSQQQGQQFGMSNLADIYRSSNGPLNSNNNSWLAGLNSMSGNQLGLLGLESQTGSRPGSTQQGFSNLFSGLGALGGGLGGWQSLLPFLGGNKQGDLSDPYGFGNLNYYDPNFAMPNPYDFSNNPAYGNPIKGGGSSGSGQGEAPRN